MILEYNNISKIKSSKYKTDSNGNVNIKEFKKWLNLQSTTYININYIIETLKRWQYKERTK